LAAVATAAGATVLAIAVNVASGSGIAQWDQASGVVAGAVGTIGLLVAAISTFLSQRATSAEDEAERTRERLATNLIRTFAAMEKEALKYKQKDPGESLRPISLCEVRSTMNGAGVWDDQDQIGFDLATRARNAIVHGDLGQRRLN
jgi:hypothetical protein